jgi:hypothetical protein
LGEAKAQAAQQQQDTEAEYAQVITFHLTSVGVTKIILT